MKEVETALDENRFCRICCTASEVIGLIRELVFQGVADTLLQVSQNCMSYTVILLAAVAIVIALTLSPETNGDQI
jgi:hypothetical protein